MKHDPKNHTSPPKWPLRLLKYLVADDYLEEVEGDLAESFEENLKVCSRRRARILYIREALRFLRPGIIGISTGILESNRYNMFKHGLLIASRQFKKYKSSFFINLLGLSTGLASVLLIYLWVNDELRIDKFHEKDKQLYQVMRNLQTPHGIRTFEGMPGPLASAMEEEIPEVESALAVRPALGKKGILTVDSKRIKAKEQYVGQAFFHLFSYQLIYGDKERVLSDRYSLVLSDELAIKLFNTTEGILGRIVEWDHDDFSGSYRVAGVFKRPSSNSSAQFDVLFPYKLFLEKRPGFLDWGNNNPATYLLLKESTDINRFNQKISGFIKSKLPTSNSTLFLRRYSDNYLYGRYENGVQAGGRIEYVRLFSIVAVFILVIACINFMNLSTARASRRIKEIGIKKAIGVHRKTLVFQYLTESLLMTFLSLCIAIVLVVIFLPQFNAVTGKHLMFEYDSHFLLAGLGIILLTGFISGSYPAFYLSGFSPALALKGKLNTSVGSLWTRKGLVIFQFTVSVILITAVVVVSQQLSYIQNKNLGYNKNHVIYFTNEGKVLENYGTFLTEVKHIPGVVHASCFANDLTGRHGGTAGVVWEGKAPDEAIHFGNLEVGYDLISLLGIEVSQGRTFSREFNDEQSKIIFNEAAIAAMGLKDPVGRTVKLWGEEKQIIGVVKNFHFESFYKEIKPCFLRLFPVSDKTLVKITEGTEAATISQLQSLYQQYNPGLPLDYKFLDEDYQALYVAEQRVAVLSRYFAGLAVLISCLGLFGLATFMAERRLKEIGIRKIFGSSEYHILRLLSGDFIKMVMVAITMALPASYLMARSWLAGFAYKIDLKPWFFIMAALVALVIAWLAISIQTIKAAKVSPVRCLRE